ncbi:MAG: aspartyl-tRNA(Asn)/glutamyl-tRNA(Gln) amidotransferase subunit [Thermoleophilaceae bacterium]|nr:aspartyl-tRNA(Asn)/glutamyl-tRNA(Gln) amidotransferase subunit [Thermoleophilaceae bacterium]
MELWELSACELLDGYRTAAFSPREVVEALAARIETLDPSLGAFTELCLERALEEADAPRPGRLSGVPFAAKDLFDSAGVRTTYGSRMFASHVPERDAALVAAMRAAGAILIGKTQTHEFAWGVTSVNDAMGSSHNPWDPSRVPGGSSGGSGVALAARMVPLALGTDTGGSIRIPAAFCGVTGLKPTYGRLDVSGAWPLAPSLDHVGPMARTAEDLALVMGVEPGPFDGCTVVVSPGLPAAGVFEELGATIVECELPACDEVFRVVQLVEAARVHGEAGLYPERADDYGKDVRTRLEHAVATDPAEYVRASAERERLRSEYARVLADGALLVTPVSGVPPVVAAEDRSPAGREFRAGVLPFTVPHNVLGIPSCAVRAGFDDLGLPVGIQIAGAPWRDEAVLAAAAAFHAATPGIQQRWPTLA